MNNFIDDSKIPKGVYCYDEKGVCPYYSQKVVAFDIIIPYCLYLDQGDLCGLTNEEFLKLKKIWAKTDEELYKMFPLDLLWDSVKECGVNEEDE